MSDDEGQDPGATSERAVDETGADAKERDAKEELFEAIDHFKNAASILFGRAASDPALRTAKEEAGRVVRKIGDAAEPLASELTKELGRLTRDVMQVVEQTTRRAQRRGRRGEDEEE